ncbi:MAG: putative N-acetylmannosamine-6-phosphate 2-epimerase [Fervidobacterium nodosum]
MIIKPFSLIVSCQAYDGEALRDSNVIARIALAAKQGGASCIRANGPEDIKAVKKMTGLPVIGIYKDFECLEKSCAFITVRKSQIKKIIEAGADVIAIDCTRRDRPESLDDLFNFIRKNYPNVEIMADIADIEDVKLVKKLKPDYFSTTLSGYTDYTKNFKKPNIELINQIRKVTNIPVIGEGHYKTPENVRKAFISGAYAVVVGTAITRPQVITKSFLDAISDLSENTKILGVDIGGTWIRMVKIDFSGNVYLSYKFENPQSKEGIFSIIRNVVSKEGDITHIGIASAGRIDVKSGNVNFASENIKNWTGVNLKEEVSRRTKIVPIVDNDANAATFAQWHLSKEENMALITVGTGIGSGAVIDGKILRGANGGFFEVGHILYPGNDLRCTCGKIGCVETLIKGEKLRMYEFKSEEEKEKLASIFAWLIDTIKTSVDFEKLYLYGVIKKYGEDLLFRIRRQYEKLSYLNKGEEILFSSLDEFGGAYGAALEALYFGRGRDE